MDIESWVDRFLPFSFLMVLFSFFWSSQFLMRSLWSFESLFLYAMCLFSLAAFKVFSLSLIFSSFNMSTCVNLSFFGFGKWGGLFFFYHSFFKELFALFFFFPFRTPIMHMLDLWYHPTDSCDCIFNLLSPFLLLSLTTLICLNSLSSPFCFNPYHEALKHFRYWLF